MHGGWENLKLEGPPGPKRNWWLGWGYREARLARNRDAGLLVEHHPEIHAWVERVMVLGF